MARLTFGSITLTFIGPPFPGFPSWPDAFLAKLTPQGLAWVKDLGTEENPESLVIDSHDNIVLSSDEGRQANSDPPLADWWTLVKLCPDGTGTPSGAAGDAGTVCSSGSTSWARRDVLAPTAAVDSNGDVYISGLGYANEDFGGGPSSPFNAFPFIVKYDGNTGVYKWANWGNIVCPEATPGCGSAGVWGRAIGFIPPAT